MDKPPKRKRQRSLEVNCEKCTCGDCEDCAINKDVNKFVKYIQFHQPQCECECDPPPPFYHDHLNKNWNMLET